MKNLALLLFVTCVTCVTFAQNAPNPAIQTFNMTLSPISLPSGKQTVAGTEAGTVITVTTNLDFGMTAIFAPGQSFQYYAGKFNYRLPSLSKKLNDASATLSGYRFQFGLTGSTGVDRILGTATTQHYGFTGGGFVNYDLTGSGHYTLGAEIQYAKFPGLANNTFTVSLDPAIHF